MAKASGSQFRPKDFISTDIPAGHDTVWGWVAKWSPQDLPATINPTKAFAAEISELREQSAAGGYTILDVAAPAALRALGADSIPAFDTQLLYMMSRS
jgi:hypothetical protein